MTTLRIKPTTIWLVAQCLNQLHYRVPELLCWARDILISLHIGYDIFWVGGVRHTIQSVRLDVQIMVNLHAV